MLADGTYISWWPNANGADCIVLRICTASALLPTDFGRDYTAEGTNPTIIHLDNLDEAAIKSWWNDFKRRNNWRSLSQNCSTVVARALDAGGGRKRAPF